MPKLPDDPRFKHVDYRHTDLAKTFARIRKQMAEQLERQAIDEAEALRKVQPMKRGAK